MSHCYDYSLLRFSPNTNTFVVIRTAVCVAHCMCLAPQLERQGLHSITHCRCNTPPTLWQSSKHYYVRRNDNSARKGPRCRVIYKTKSYAQTKRTSRIKNEFEHGSEKSRNKVISCTAVLWKKVACTCVSHFNTTSKNDHRAMKSTHDCTSDCACIPTRSRWCWRLQQPAVMMKTVSSNMSCSQMTTFHVSLIVNKHGVQVFESSCVMYLKPLFFWQKDWLLQLSGCAKDVCVLTLYGALPLFNVTDALNPQTATRGQICPQSSFFFR